MNPPWQTRSMTTPAPRTFTIEIPTLADVPALARIHVRGWEVAYGHALEGEQWFGAPALERRRAHWTAWLTPGTPESEQAEFRIGRAADGTAVGLAASWPPRDPDPVRARELSTLYVDEAWFGTGLGRELVVSLLGEEPASLWVAEDNPRARRFYEKLGFRPDGARRTDDRWPELPDLRMVR